MKNSNDTIGNRTHGLLACRTVPQPTAPPRALHFKGSTEQLQNRTFMEFRSEFSHSCPYVKQV